MENSYRINFRSSQINEKEKMDSLRGSQLSLLNLNDLTRSFVNSNDSKSERTPNKLNYKYQRVNNSFRLVQIDQSDAENKENVQEPSKTHSHILMTLNSLSERIEKIQKGQNFDEQKQKFYIHKIVEKIVSENKDSKYFQGVQKKLQYAFYEINQIRQKVNTLSALPKCFSETEENLINKFKQLHQQQRLTGDKLSRLSDQYDELRVKTSQICSQLQKSMKNIINELGKQLETKIEQALKQNPTLENHSSKWEANKIKLQEDLKIIQSSISQIGLKLSGQNIEEKQKCMNKILGSISLELKIASLLSAKQTQHKMEQSLQIVRYGIDTDGLLVDSEGFYLVDKKGKTIKLSEEQLKKLEAMNILEKK